MNDGSCIPLFMDVLMKQRIIIILMQILKMDHVNQLYLAVYKPILFNCDDEATTDDGSCIIPFIYGCTDDTMFNYNH